MKKIALVCLTIGAFGVAKAEGEYAHLHVGPYLGIAVSPSKDFQTFANTIPGGDVVKTDGGGLLGVQLGIGGTWSFHPSSFRLGLDLDITKTLSKEADDPKGSLVAPDGTVTPLAVSVSQTAVRATLKCIFAFRPNTYPSWYWWIGPTFTQAQTKLESTDLAAVSSSYLNIKTYLHGGGMGLGRRTIGESRMGVFEINAFYLKPSSVGLNAGGLTIEMRGGIQF